MYTPDDYDRYSSLKPSFGLYLTLFFGIKNVLLILIPFVASIKRKVQHLDYLQDLVQPVMLVSDVIVLIVVIALIKRNPESNVFWKGVWQNGRLLINVALIYQLVMLGIQVLIEIGTDRYIQINTVMPMFYFMFITLLFILNLNTSKRIKDTFLDWPRN